MMKKIQLIALMVLMTGFLMAGCPPQPQPPVTTDLVKEFQSKQRTFLAATESPKPFAHGEVSDGLEKLLEAKMFDGVESFGFEFSTNGKGAITGVGVPAGGTAKGPLKKFALNYELVTIAGDNDILEIKLSGPVSGKDSFGRDPIWAYYNSKFLWSKSKNVIRTVLVFDEQAKAGVNFNSFADFDKPKFGEDIANKFTANAFEFNAQ